MLKQIRICGDSHGVNNRPLFHREYLSPQAKGRYYLDIIKDSEYNLHLGDIGWGDDLDMIRRLDSNKLKICYGNHENYDDILPHSLGDYGITSLNEIEFGFVRGELSVDKQYRKPDWPKKSWWQEEELTTTQMIDCMKYFDNLTIQPSLMISHGCPTYILSEVVTNKWKLEPSNTAKLLSSVYQSVRPRLWIFGHMHNNKVIKYEDTTFVCLNELCWVDLSIVDGKYVLKGDINLEVEF